jgi:hypothetical protein
MPKTPPQAARREIDRQPEELNFIRFLVASAKTRIIGGKTYKGREETTDCRQDGPFIKLTKQVIWAFCVLGTTDAYNGHVATGSYSTARCFAADAYPDWLFVLGM